MQDFVKDALRHHEERLLAARMAFTEDAADVATAAKAANDLGAVLTATNTALQNPAVPAATRLLLAPKITQLVADRNKLIAPLTNLSGRCAMPKGYKGPITPEDREGTTRTLTPIFARLFFQQGALSLSFTRSSVKNGFDIFHKGRGEPAGVYGYEADVTINQHITNLLEKGLLPEGHFFNCMGIGFRAARVDGAPVRREDMEALGSGQVAWSQKQRKQSIQYPSVAQMPAPHDVREAAGTATFWSGPPYVQDEPLFVLRTGEGGHSMRIEWESDDYELEEDTYLYVYLLGEHGQVPGGQ